MTKTRRQSYTQGWSLYPGSTLGHHLQGALAAVAILLGSAQVLVAALVWTFLYVAYQGLTFLRKKDSAGLDVSDYVFGFGLGCVGVACWQFYLVF